MVKNKYFRLLQNIFFVFAWAFIGYFVIKNHTAIAHFLIIKNWHFFWLSLLILFPGYWAQFLLRKQLTQIFALKIPFAKQFYIFGHNGILKYLPGGVWNHLDAVLLLEQNGHNGYKQPSKLVFLEMFWRVVSGWIIFAPFLFNSTSFIVYLKMIYFPSLIFIISGLVLLSKKHPSIYLYSFKNLSIHLFYNLIFWLGNGLSLLFLIAAFYGSSFINLNSSLYLVAASSLSWIAGFLFIPAPSGLGVREYLLSLFLERFSLNLTLGFSLSLLERVLIMTRDVVMYLIAKLITKQKP